MNITISGPPGSGKSTTAKALAKRLGMKLIIGGDIFRQMAKDRNMTLAEFTKYSEEDSEIDHQLDEKLREISEREHNIVIESRLAGHLCEADFKIWLDAPAPVRLKRLKKRINDTETPEEMMIREKSEAKRYKEYYDIDMHDKSIYDMIINTSKITIEETVDLIVKEMRKRKLLTGSSLSTSR